MNDKALKQLRWLAAQGATFCLPAGRTKGQLPAGWQRTPKTLAEAELHAQHAGNVGVLCGAPSGGIVAVDVDVDWETQIAKLGDFAQTVTVQRDGADGRGKLLYKVTSDPPRSRAWKRNPTDERPSVELLSTGRHALIPPSEYEGGAYLLHGGKHGIKTVTHAELEGVWWLLTGETFDQAAREATLTRSPYVAQVKQAWTCFDVFAHFGKVGADVKRRTNSELHVTGNAGLLVREDRWFCHADGVGGDNLDAWHWCETGRRLDRNDKDAFWRVVNAMAAAKGIEKPEGAARRTTAEEPAEGVAAELQTDMGNASRLARLHGHGLRYVPAWGWLHWDGTRWQPDETGTIMRVAKQTAQTLFDDAIGAMKEAERGAQSMREAVAGADASKAMLEQAQAEADALLKEAKNRLSWAIKSQSRQRLDAMIALAQSDAPIPARAGDFDADPWLLNVQNGVIDLRSGRLLPHSSERLITKLAPVTFDADAHCPNWHTFLHRIFGGDGDVIDYLQRWLGYCLTGDVSEQYLHALWGSGSNGKSVLIGTVLAMLGDYAATAAPDLLLARDNRHPTEVADLQGKRFVASVETDEGRRLAEAAVKHLTGGDRVKARRMREDFWEFAPTHKLALVTNHKPRVNGTDHAIWRRLRLVPFEVVIPDAEQDKALPTKLQGELPGVLAWCVRGCLEWQRRGLSAPAKVNAATEAYKAENDHLASFLAECVIEHHGAEVQAKDLYRAYAVWCEDNGQKPMNGTAFGLRLGERGFDKYKHPRTTRTYYLHVALITEDEPESAGSS